MRGAAPKGAARQVRGIALESFSLCNGPKAVNYGGRGAWLLVEGRPAVSATNLVRSGDGVCYWDS